MRTFFNNKSLRIFLVIFIIIANVGCDQISKNIVRENVHDNQRINVIDHFFTLTKVENSGAFLGLGSNFPPLIKKIVFTALPTLVLGFAVFLIFSKFNFSFLSVLGFGFMIGGGIGNVFDRIVYSSVTDFLHLDFGFISTGIFNLADVSIMIGMLLLALPHLKHSDDPSENADSVF